MEIVKSTSVVISEQNENDIKEGVQWLKDWLQKRLLNEDIRNDFIHYEGMNWQEIYTDCANKLDGMKFIVGKDGEDVASILREDLQSGKIHLNDRYLRRFKNDTDKAIESFCNDAKEAFVNGDALGCAFDNIEEPVITLTEEAIKSDVLSAIVAHECTHVMDFWHQEDEVRKIVQDGSYYSKSRFEQYLDSGEEAYARTMQFRKAFNIDPCKKYTIDDIKKLRDEFNKNSSAEILWNEFLSKKKSFTNEELHEAMNKANEKINPEQDVISVKKDFLGRYTDEQIIDLLNNVASVDVQLQSDNLRNDMKKDFAINASKMKLFKKINNKPKNVENSDLRPKDNKKNFDVLYMQINNDNQYS